MGAYFKYETYIAVEELIFWNQSDRIDRLWSVGVVVGSWSMKLFDINPFDAFVTRESKGYSRGSLNEAWDINPNMSVDCLA